MTAPIGCRGKVAFATYTGAKQTARKMRRKKDDVVEPYRCQHCRKYHVGHPSAESVRLRVRRRAAPVGRRVAARAHWPEDD